MQHEAFAGRYELRYGGEVPHSGLARRCARLMDRVFVASPDTRYLRREEGVGASLKPVPRKRIPPDLRSLARGHTELCIRVLAGIVSQEAMPPAARVSAAGILLDRGWGKATQEVTVDSDIKITIRKMLDVIDAEEVTVLDDESESLPRLPKHN
jgi:hypothetical protein